MPKAGTHAYGPDYFRHQGWWRGETLPGWLERAARERPDGAAIVARDGGVVGYRKLASSVGRLTAALRRLGIARGDVVAVHLPNIRLLRDAQRRRHAGL